MVLDQFDGYVRVGFAVVGFDDLAEGPFADEFSKLKTVCNLVSGYDAVVALLIVKAVVDEPLQLGWLVLLVVWC